MLSLRNDSAHRERRFYGASADKEIVKEPVYDVKVLDRLVRSERSVTEEAGGIHGSWLTAISFSLLATDIPAPLQFTALQVANSR